MTLYIRQQESVEHGEIAAVLIGDEATLKRVYIYDDRISEEKTPSTSHGCVPGQEMNNIRILGKAVASYQRDTIEGRIMRKAILICFILVILISYVRLLYP